MAIVLGTLQLVVNFALLVYIIVEFNMDKFCDRMLVFAFDGKESLSNSHYHLMDCFYDEERSKNRLLDVKSERNGVFWLHAHMKSDVDEDHQKLQGKKVTLQQLVHHSYTWCNLIYDEYKGISEELASLMVARLLPEDKAEVDGGDESRHQQLLTRYEAELYLRPLYLTLKEQFMVNDVTEISDYVGSRQQCLYGCISFLMLFFSMYDSIDLMNLKNFNWFQGTVMKGGCSLISLCNSSQQSPPSMSVRSFTLALVGIDKLIAECVFDLVNTSNPSGGLIGPGNSSWFHKLMLKMFGMIGPDYKKLIKNHACIHDACGFVMNHFEMPMYMHVYTVYLKKMY